VLFIAILATALLIFAKKAIFLHFLLKYIGNIDFVEENLL